MAKKKQDTRKPRLLAGIRVQFIPGLEQMAHRLGENPTDVVNTAVREYLERQGLWPPQDTL